MVVSADTVTNQDLENGDFSGVLGLACTRFVPIRVSPLTIQSPLLQRSKRPYLERQVPIPMVLRSSIIFSVPARTLPQIASFRWHSLVGKMLEQDHYSQSVKPTTDCAQHPVLRTTSLSSPNLVLARPALCTGESN